MKVLIVDDEKNIRDSMLSFLKLEQIEAETAENGLKAQEMIKEISFDACVIDFKMPGMNGMDLLAWIKNDGPSIPVIMVSAHGEISDAVNAMKLGAEDYIQKPFDPEELIIRIRRAVENRHFRERIETGKRVKNDNSYLIGKSDKINEIRVLIEKIASTTSTVLITGESGTGKEIIAKNIHALSPRSESPFVPINVGGIPDTLLESELFGFEKGAFTGANNRKNGLFEVASSGTLFLDEIGDMPLPLQVKLLRVLQEKKIQRLGSTQSIPIDIRIIAATNKDLKSLIQKGTFREDLFFRLNVIHISMPPLRDRLDDIPLFIGHCLKTNGEKLNKGDLSIEQEAVDLMLQYSYPGNIRELENIMERAAILCDTNIIRTSDLEILAPSKKTKQVRGTLAEIEKEVVIETLERWQGNRTKASEELGITRMTLINKIKEYSIDMQKTDISAINSD